MRSRPFGNTGLAVSELALGTVELGLDYGFAGSAHYRCPEEAEAVRVVRRAVELGINLLDTARAYGDAERRIGLALRGMRERPMIATKFALPEGLPRERWRGHVIESLEASLRALGLECVELLQIHSATPEMLASEELARAFGDLRGQGKILHAGASVYGAPAALAAIERPAMRAVQVPFNMLDRAIEPEVLPRAARAGVALLARSAFLRGVLTPRLEESPAALTPLKEKARAALRAAGAPVSRLSELALRFCLSFPTIASVIVGVRSVEELETNAAAAELGPLPGEWIEKWRPLAEGDEALVSPANWRGLI